jgi:hypothetical protein
MVVLSQGDDMTLRSHVETAAAADLDVGTLEFPDQRSIRLEDSHMETVSMTVTDEHITSIADVNAVGIIGDVLTANATQKLAIFIEDYNTVALGSKSSNQENGYLVKTYLEVTHKVLFATDGNVGGLTHIVAAIKPFDQVP